MDIIFNSTENLPVSLDEFKSYVVETSNHRDVEMTTMLNSAIRKVEEHCNLSLADHSITLIQDNKKLYQKLYYRPVNTITSVTDSEGLELIYKADVNNRKVALETISDMIINYTTVARSEDKHKQAILDYASLLYNGCDVSKDYMMVLRNCENKL